jgi:hypothetical protein
LVYSRGPSCKSAEEDAKQSLRLYAIFPRGVGNFASFWVWHGAAYNSAAISAALQALGSGAERDFRIVEGV